LIHTFFNTHPPTHTHTHTHTHTNTHSVHGAVEESSSFDEAILQGRCLAQVKRIHLSGERLEHRWRSLHRQDLHSNSEPALSLHQFQLNQFEQTWPLKKTAGRSAGTRECELVTRVSQVQESDCVAGSTCVLRVREQLLLFGSTIPPQSEHQGWVTCG
jgi:hypothetical protein